MNNLFYPRSVAVIGVSEQPDNLAANIVRNLIAFGFGGDIHAVGLRRGEVHGVPILPSVNALPDDVDLATILTPAPTVPDLLEACGRKGIQYAVIETGGFTEFSDRGKELSEQVVEEAERWNMRIVGPNCISVINMENGLCLPFARIDPDAAKRGPVSVLAQSGGVSITYLILLSEAGLGANKIVSMGNKADLDETEYLAYLLEDEGTEVICLYLESVEEGRRFLEVAASSAKPIIVQKANRSRAGAEIAFSHTAALTNDDAVVDAALQQAGLARARSFEDAVALAQGFVLPPVKGDNLLVISRSGGHAVVAADAAEAAGFRLMPLSESFGVRVRRKFRADVIAPKNPLDLGAVFDFDLYGQIIEEGLAALRPDALLLVHTYSSGPEAVMSRRLVRRLGELSRAQGLPLALCAFAQRDEINALNQQTKLPIFSTIEGAVRALSASRAWHTRPANLLPMASPPRDRPDKVEALLRRDGPLTTDSALDLCASFGIPVEEWAVVSDEESALFAAGTIGYPVALKGLSARASHKSEGGLVVLGIGTPSELRSAFRSIRESLETLDGPTTASRVMVQTMVSGGPEVIIGGKRDSSFGPVVLFGLGGVNVELLEDVVLRLAPISREQAAEMVDELRGSALLRGARGESEVDVETILDSLVGMSDLLTACPEVMEIEVNPLIAFDDGAAALDARGVVSGQRA